MIRASKVWPYYTPWTLSDVKTAAWLVENDHFPQLMRVRSSSYHERTSITTESSVWATLVDWLEPLEPCSPDWMVHWGIS